MRIVRSLLVAAIAFCGLEAQAVAQAPDTKIEDIKFTDADKLTTSGLTADAMIVTGEPRKVRTILTRPRFTFVPELLASIQNL